MTVAKVTGCDQQMAVELGLYNEEREENGENTGNLHLRL